jgi:hypothetical protein
MSERTPEEYFRTAIDKTPSRDDREAAIDALIDIEACDKLTIIVQMGGLDGPYRRRALNGLAEADCHDRLETITENGSLTGALCDDAEQLLHSDSNV